MSYILALDVGTTALKIGVFGRDLRLRSLRRAAYGLSFPKPLWAEASPELWWKLILRELPLAIRQAKIRPAQIDAIGISTLCPAMVAMDSSGEPLNDAIIYLDQRSVAQAKEIGQIVTPAAMAKITGNRMASGTISLPGMLWLKRHKPAIYRRSAMFGHANTFLCHKLTGQFGMDWTNASFTGLFDIRKRQWSAKLCAALGVDLAKLPPILAPSDVVGGVMERVSRITGIRAGVPVVMGAADTACAALAVGVTENGQGFASSGGSEVITACTDDPHFNPAFLNRCHVVPQRWLSHGTVSTAGSAVEWFKSLLGTGSYEEMIARITRSPDGANGVIFLPYLMGERPPIWNSHLRGAFLGLTPSVTADDMTRAVAEGVGYALRQIITAMEADGKVRLRKLTLVGSGARNKAWAQIKADITGRALALSPIEEAALLGSGMLAAVGSGLYPSYARVLAALAKPKCKTLRPRKIKQHERNYAAFRAGLTLAAGISSPR